MVYTNTKRPRKIANRLTTINRNQNGQAHLGLIRFSSVASVDNLPLPPFIPNILLHKGTTYQAHPNKPVWVCWRLR